MMLLGSVENYPLLSDENKWGANEGVRKGSVVNFIALVPSCGASGSCYHTFHGGTCGESYHTYHMVLLVAATIPTKVVLVVGVV